jgi:hypothetical protein
MLLDDNNQVAWSRDAKHWYNTNFVFVDEPINRIVFTGGKFFLLGDKNIALVVY